MSKEQILQEITEKEYIVRMLVGLLVEIIADMNSRKQHPDSYAFALLVRHIITTVRMLEEVME